MSTYECRTLTAAWGIMYSMAVTIMYPRDELTQYAGIALGIIGGFVMPA
jgi:hypothetical protein